MEDDNTRNDLLWLVERTYSDDEQNIIILTYATTDGRRYHRKERALTSFTNAPDVTAAVRAHDKSVGPVDDPDLVERYAKAATRMAADHDPGDAV